MRTAYLLHFHLTVIVIPALLSISPIKSVDAKRASFLEKNAESVFGWISDVATHRSKTVIFISVIWVVLGGYYTVNQNHA